MQLSLDKLVDKTYLGGMKIFFDYAFRGLREEDEIRCS